MMHFAEHAMPSLKKCYSLEVRAMWDLQIVSQHRMRTDRLAWAIADRYDGLETNYSVGRQQLGLFDVSVCCCPVLKPLRLSSVELCQSLEYLAVDGLFAAGQHCWRLIDHKRIPSRAVQVGQILERGQATGHMASLV